MGAFTLEAVSNIQNDYVLITFESICKFHIRYKELEKVFSYREKNELGAWFVIIREGLRTLYFKEYL